MAWGEVQAPKTEESNVQTKIQENIRDNAMIRAKPELINATKNAPEPVRNAFSDNTTAIKIITALNDGNRSIAITTIVQAAKPKMTEEPKIRNDAEKYLNNPENIKKVLGVWFDSFKVTAAIEYIKTDDPSKKGAVITEGKKQEDKAVKAGVATSGEVILEIGVQGEKTQKGWLKQNGSELFSLASQVGYTNESLYRVAAYLDDKYKTSLADQYRPTSITMVNAARATAEISRLSWRTLVEELSGTTKTKEGDREEQRRNREEETAAEKRKSKKDEETQKSETPEEKTRSSERKTEDEKLLQTAVVKLNTNVTNLESEIEDLQKDPTATKKLAKSLGIKQEVGKPLTVNDVLESKTFKDLEIKYSVVRLMKVSGTKEKTLKAEAQKIEKLALSNKGPKLDGSTIERLDPAIKIALTEALDAAVTSMTAKVIAAREE
ncbi:MAG: hypothetical protein Q7S22_02950 [Candidatus Micrarchaeota archaeon]|nr:hypothetical protein [Candidatus Micrarchaeota archaeon]